ncbi:hypothetical protein A8139_05155 [Marinomonas primoryensis]|uniref:Uncharacterized protein n=1 Tax=Marinomonas primoryensis TaxID=178399 RepID=A0A2Z4PPQ7_9GAMM|nr:hypothetical protein [Marinomonas primoryensis]AWX99452.1 hypothetical protein A8139_05155 [Marinomonas primoryensis]
MKLYRGIGVDHQPTEGILKNKYLKSPRRPLHSTHTLHSIADNWFQNKFGILARSQTIFCTPNKYQASQFGSVVEVEPIYNSFNVSFIFSQRVHDFNEIETAVTKIEDKIQVEAWLNSMSYIMVNKASDIPEKFDGEIMLYCDLYKVKYSNE